MNQRMKRWTQVTAWLLTLVLILSACQTAEGTDDTTVASTITSTTTSTTTEATTTEATTTEAASAELPTEDRAGNALNLEAPAESVAVMAPAYAQIMEGLGALERIAMVDTNTPMAVPALQELPQMDLFAPNVELLISEQPDLILVSSISMAGGEDDPFRQAQEAGIEVAYIPTADTLADIAEDIRFIGAVLGMEKEGEQLAADYEANLLTLSELAAGIEEPKQALFEVSPAPDIYSFGSGVYLHEMLETVNIRNILADQEGWLPVTEEAALAANPDLIFTSANWLEDPVQEILDRSAWASVTAIEEGDVYYIENNHTQLPSQRVVDGMLAMAQAAYPDVFGDVELR